MGVHGFRGKQYDIIEPIGSGGSAQVLLVRDQGTDRLYAMKYISRGSRYVTESVVREIMNHRSLRHPNVIRFVQLVLTSNHLGIVMEYAKGGPLSGKINEPGLREDEARKYFQQLIYGVSYCHSQGVCH